MAHRESDCDLELVRCLCGGVIHELVVPVGARMASRGVLLRYKCDRCKHAILEYSPDAEGLSPRRLLVMHVLDLHTGDVVPDMVGIFKDHVTSDRSLTRGGERLPRAILDRALVLRDEALARARSGV